MVLRRGREGLQGNGQFCSWPSGLQHTQWDYKLESCVSPSVACGPPAAESPEVLKFEAPSASPCGGSETSVFSWPSRALMPPRLEKPGLKGLELPTTPTPQGPLPGIGVHWSSGGLVPASQPWGGDTGSTSSGQAGRQAGWPWVSTGASRLVCVQPSRGRP